MAYQNLSNGHTTRNARECTHIMNLYVPGAIAYWYQVPSILVLYHRVPGTNCGAFHPSHTSCRKPCPPPYPLPSMRLSRLMCIYRHHNHNTYTMEDTGMCFYGNDLPHGFFSELKRGEECQYSISQLFFFSFYKGTWYTAVAYIHINTRYLIPGYLVVRRYEGTRIYLVPLNRLLGKNRSRYS